MSQSCGNCRFWERIDWPDRRVKDEGLCRRYPPQVYGPPVSMGTGQFHANRPPITIDANWCGEWKRLLTSRNR